MEASNNTTLSRCAELTYNTEDLLVVAIYILIGVSGLFGNVLVIYVILHSPKMKTVTNMYIFNLALSDLIFLLHIAMITTTMIVKQWIFGEAVCKIFFMTNAITVFSSALTLTSLSVDRYIAVCKPVISQKIRQPRKAAIVIMCVWFVSLLLSMPIILYAQRKENSGTYSCQVDWPDPTVIPAYIIYIFILGFAVPFCFISILYTSVIIHMKRAGPANRQRSTEQRKNHRKVTFLVLAIILVYVICWLPYWTFQIIIAVLDLYTASFSLPLFKVTTVLTFANSMINPVLYAFLSENFRQAFKEVFRSRCICRERIRYFLQTGDRNEVELDSTRRPGHMSNQTEAVSNEEDKTEGPQDGQTDNGGVYTGP